MSDYMDYEETARGIVEQALSKAVWNASRQQAIIEPLVPAIAAAIREAVEGEREACAKECDRLYSRERKHADMAYAAEDGDLHAYHYHRRRGDGFFDAAHAIRRRALAGKE